MQMDSVPTAGSLSQQVQNAVVHNPHVNHHRIHFRTKENRVTIEGTADSFFEKQMAQEALRKIDGISAIENKLSVELG